MKEVLRLVFYARLPPPCPSPHLRWLLYFLSRLLARAAALLVSTEDSVLESESADPSKVIVKNSAYCFNLSGFL